MVFLSQYSIYWGKNSDQKNKKIAGNFHINPELFRSGQVIILDNASFHRKKKLNEIIEKAGCKLIFLPPYSPDLNPIEHFWDWLKNKVRDVVHQFETLELAILAAVKTK